MQLLACLAMFVSGAVVGPEGVDIQSNHLQLIMTPGGGGAIEELRLLATQHDLAGAGGLLQEGFGVGSFYRPNRRLNEKLEVVDEVTDRPVLRYSYDCDGANISGLHVMRTVELMPDQPVIYVTWRIENQGSEDQWVAPWVRNDIAVGGAFDAQDRIDLPTLDGVQGFRQSGWHAASRNWAAVTDPNAQETVYAVFHADHLHSLLADYDQTDNHCGFQAAFIPQVIRAGTAWETRYALGVVRGLTRVDFATEEFAAQITYQSGHLDMLLAGVQAMPNTMLRLRLLDPAGEVIKMPGRKFNLASNKLIRCGYDWEAPSEGTYEVLGQFVRDGSAVPLGGDTGSPHGGMDTQFVVGKGGPAPLEAWTNAPHALDRGARTLKRALANPLDDPARDTAVWFDSPMHALFQEDQVEPAGRIETTAKLSLARNERQSVQLALRPPAGIDLHAVNVKVHALLRDQGEGTIGEENIAVSNVAYYPVTVPTHFENPTGAWPDPLPPLQPFTAAGGRTHGIWLTVYAPEDTPAGIYTGLVEVSSPDLAPLDLFLQATVYDFTLPEQPYLRTDFGYWAAQAETWAKRMGGTGNIDAAYLENALEHRVTLRQLAQLPPESADYPRDLARYSDKLEQLEQAGATTFAVPASLLDVPEQLALADDFVVEHGLQNRVFCPMADMPEQPAWPRLFEQMQAWKDQAPHIPIMVTTYGLGPFIPQVLDIWCVHSPMLDTLNNRAILERAQAGEPTWWFVNHEPGRPYANFFVEFAPVEQRVFFWQTWALGIDGVYYHGINALPLEQNPYENQLDITPANGNGCLVYPGPDGPVNSIRWETIRDGIEDYDYLVIFQRALRKLKETGGHAALLAEAEKAGNIGGVVPDLVSFPRDPAMLEAKRNELARMIVRMHEALGTP